MSRGKCGACEHGAKKEMFGNIAFVCTKNPPIVVPLPTQGTLAGQMGIQLTSLNPGVNPEDEYGCWEKRSADRQIQEEVIDKTGKSRLVLVGDDKSKVNKEGFQAASRPSFKEPGRE